MAEWSSSYITVLPDSAFACPDTRTYPHHDSSGAVDLPHLRAALSRIGDPSNNQCGKAHLEAHAKTENVGEAKALMPVQAKALEPDEETAWFAGRIPRRLNAIPFGGPIPHPRWPRGVDWDAETFTPRTDIFGGIRALKQNRERLSDWSHSYMAPDKRYGDPTGMMTGHVIGKSILDPDPEEDGWWVDFWFKAGDKRVRMIEALARRGAMLFGSSQPVPGKAQRGKDGEITVWPFALETLSTAPNNTLSSFLPAKAVLEEADLAGISISDAMRSLIGDMRDLDSDLRRTSLAGNDGAKSGQVPDISLILTEYEERTGRVSARLASMLDRFKQKD